jgi:hypothetical protein
MKRSDAFPSQYLNAADLAGRGELPVIIEHVAQENIGNDEDQRSKPVMYFKNGSKGLPLNGTNWDALAAVFGDESDGWIGKQVILWVDPAVRFRGKPTPGIRFKSPPAKAVAEKPTAGKPQLKTVSQQSEDPAADMDDQIPF